MFETTQIRAAADWPANKMRAEISCQERATHVPVTISVYVVQKFVTNIQHFGGKPEDIILTSTIHYHSQSSLYTFALNHHSTLPPSILPLTNFCNLVSFPKGLSRLPSILALLPLPILAITDFSNLECFRQTLLHYRSRFHSCTHYVTQASLLISHFLESQTEISSPALNSTRFTHSRNHFALNSHSTLPLSFFVLTNLYK